MPTVINVDHVNPFVQATIETFRSMLGAEIRPGRPALKQGLKAFVDISGIIGLSGGAKGSVILGFPRLTALKAVSAFVGEKVVTVDDSVVDAIGELANIVAGAAKKDLARFNIAISLPTVVIGGNHEHGSPKDVTPIVVPCDSGFGNFYLIVSFKSGN